MAAPSKYRRSYRDAQEREDAYRDQQAAKRARAKRRTCGTHHKTHTAASRHSRRLNLASYRRGQGRPWDPEKKQG